MRQPDLFAPAERPMLQPRARITDPGTSHEAAKAFRGKPCLNHYAAILGVLWRPMVPPEISKLTGLTVVQIDRRRKELIDAGEVRLTGKERDGCQEWERVL